MAITKIILFQFLILATVHLLMAENDDGGLFGLPSGKGGPGAGMPDADLFHNLTEDGEKEGEEHENRLFFSLFSATRLATCNFTATPGRSCLSCRQAQTCLSSNVSIIRTCRGFLSFCNNGGCSLFPGSACNSTG